jgi:antitoxin HicB
MNKTVEYYMGLAYTIELWRAPEGGWVIQVKELPGCVSQGETAEEALAMIQDAMRGWLEVALEMDDAIPEPRPEEGYSGKFVVRVPRSLHRALVEEADRDGASLNQYINVALARAVGRPAASQAAEAEPGWPGLKPAVRQALLVAGIGAEAGELDERLFASWADSVLAQVESALEGGDYRDVYSYLEILAQALRLAASRSPAIAAFYRTVTLLREHVESAQRRQQEALNPEQIAERILSYVGQDIRARLEKRDRNEEAHYAGRLRAEDRTDSGPGRILQLSSTRRYARQSAQ